MQRQFLLRPDASITNAIAYCLADAARRTDVVVLVSTVESNHHHTVIFDRHGRFPKFIEHFHKMVAKCVNVARRRKENLWATHETCVTRLLDYETILAKLAYTAANPVKDHLVERAVDWPGVNGYRYLCARTPLRATRPSFFFRRDRAWPEELELPFVIPPELGSSDEIIAELEARVTAIENEARRTLKAAGKRVLGRDVILKQRCNTSPRSLQPPRLLRPRYAGMRQARIDALCAFRSFLAAYRDARQRWINGESCVFPAGTYWIMQFTPILRATQST